MPQEGIKLFFYYSLLDWNRDDYFPRGRTGKGIKGRGEGEMGRIYFIYERSIKRIINTIWRYWRYLV